ncbi:ATP-binding cassette domain-containing protein [Pseudomonadota bacterium]
MEELFKRLKTYPYVTAELLAASLFANILALATPLFVIQVLNRYVSHGVDATLMTLAAGVVVAIAFELAFRQIRLNLGSAFAAPFDKANADRVFRVLTGARADALAQVPPGQKREAAAGADAVRQAYNAPSVAAYLDLPFALVFLLALLMLSAPLAAIAVLVMALVVVIGVAQARAMSGPTAELQRNGAERQGLLDSALADPETVRAFTAQNHLRDRWSKLGESFDAAHAKITTRQGGAQNLTYALQALMSTAIISVGAMLVVGGKLDVGLLIGANILAARALAPVVRMTQLAGPLAKAKSARQAITQILQTPMERLEGSALGSYSGGIEFKDLGFAYPGQPTPLFESLNLKLGPGAVLVVSGGNGAGKTTLAKLLAGLLSPSRGQILVDGLELAQVAPEWWRRQTIYLPQEPTFINATVRENILAYSPDLDDAGLNKVVRDAGLEKFFAESQLGFDMMLANGGRNLPLGIRRRLALARALASGGRLVIMDEPTEGLDGEGAQQVGHVMNALSQHGCTIIAFSHDPNVIQGAPHILDLNAKPVPRLLKVESGDNSGSKGLEA